MRLLKALAPALILTAVTLPAHSQPAVWVDLENKSKQSAAQGRLAEAAEYERKAAAMVPEMPGVVMFKAVSLKNLSGLYIGLDKKAEAVDAARQSVSIARKELGDNAPKLSIFLNGLGIALIKSDKFDEAERTLMEALVLAHKPTGDPNLEISTLNALSNLQLTLGKTKEAEVSANEAYTLATKPGVNPAEYAIASGNLAALIMHKGENERAVELLKKSIEISERDGLLTAGIVASYENLAQALANLRQTEESDKYRKKALELSMRTYGENHPHTLAIKNSAAIKQAVESKPAKAVKAFDPVLDKQKAKSDEELSLQEWNSRIDAAQSLAMHGKQEKAKGILQNCIAKLDKPEADNVRANALCALAGIHIAAQEQQEAVPLLQSALAIREKLDSDSEDLAQVCTMLAVAVSKSDPKLADAMYQRALDNYAKLPPNSFTLRYSGALKSYLSFLIENKREDEAAVVLKKHEKALEGLPKIQLKQLGKGKAERK